MTTVRTFAQPWRLVCVLALWATGPVAAQTTGQEPAPRAKEWEAKKREAAAAEAKARAGKRAAAKDRTKGTNAAGSLNLVIDYLPAVLYRRESKREPGDPLTLVCRVENASAKTRTIAVRAEPKGDAGVPAGERSEEVPAGGYLRFEHTFRAGDYNSIVLTAAADGAVQIRREILMVDPDDAVPAGLRAVGGWLALEKDRFAVLRIKKKTYKKNETWQLARFIYNAVKSKEIPDRVLLYGHPLSEAAEDAAGATGIMAEPIARAARKLSVKFDAYPLRIGRHEYTYPVLKLLANLDAALDGGAKAGGAVLLLGPDDPQLATPRRLYRMAVEAILDRLESAGVSRTLVVGPVTWGVPPKQLASYVASARMAARTRRARFLDLSGVLERRHWQEENDAGVLGRYPSAEGLNAAAKAIVKELQ